MFNSDPTMALNSKHDETGETEMIEKVKTSIEKLVNLKENDFSTRYCILKDIQGFLFEHAQKTAVENTPDNLLQNIIKVLFDCLKDRSEKCRELSVKNLCILLDSSNVELCLQFIPTVLVLRLGKSDEREPSEEVRLLEVDLLCRIIDKFCGDFLKYMNDISNILTECIVDDYPEVKRKSCECASLLARKQKTNFHLISSSVLKSLLHTVTHQHFRTRTVCVKTIGQVVCNGNNKDFENAITHIAQRLFDHSPVVRMAVTEVIGLWLLELIDRYSYFNQLIPLMLSTLHDEVSEIKLKGNQLWVEAGKKYIIENENDYKDLMDFPPPSPKNYPDKVERPSVGCRILVQRNMYGILPPLLRDLSDWVPATRTKSVQVLYSLIIHAEDKATIQLPSIIDGVVAAAKDEEKKIAELAIECAEILGFFLDPNLLCDTVMTLIYKSPSAVHLSIFAAVLRGNKKGLSINCFQAICKLLSDSSVCRLRQAEEQANLLLCIEAVLSSHNKIDEVTSYQIFIILCTISGLTENSAVSEKALFLLEYLANEQSCNLESLYKKHSLPFLKSLISNNELWIPENPEFPIFYFLVHFEYTSEEILIPAISVMTNNLNLNKDVKLRSKIFTLLINVFKKLPPSPSKELSEKILSLIHNGVFPNLTWAPGKAAGSLRTVAAASLYEIIRKDCINQFMIKSICKELLPVLATLSDEDEVSTRLLSCKILEILLPKLYGCVDDYKIHATCHDFLHCMDDGSDDIRISATKLFKAYVTTFPKDYAWNSYRSYLQELYRNVLIHMDDKNEKIKESVLNLLKEIAFADPQLLLNEVEEKKYVMASSKYCEDLLEHIKNLHV